MERKINQKHAATNQKIGRSFSKSGFGLINNVSGQTGLKKSSNAQEHRLLNMDDTFLQNINLDEIEQEADDLVCQSSKRALVNVLHKKVNKWPSLSLRGSNRSVAETKTCKGLIDPQDTSGNLYKKNRTPHQKQCTNVVEKSNKSSTEIKTIDEEIKQFYQFIQSDLLSKQSKDTAPSKVKNSSNAFENTSKKSVEDLDFLKVSYGSKPTVDKGKIMPNHSRPMDRKETTLKTLPNSKCKISSFQEKDAEEILSNTVKSSEVRKRLSQNSLNQKQSTDKIASANAFDINVSDFLDNDDFKSFLEENIANNVALNKLGASSQSPALFSSVDSTDAKSKLRHCRKPADSQSKVNSDSLNCIEASDPEKLSNKKISPQNKLSDSQNAFSQFFNCSQVVRQLDDAVLHEENTIKDNSSNTLSHTNMNENEASEITENTKTKSHQYRETTERMFKLPFNNCTSKINNKRKSLDNEESTNKVPKMNSTNAAAAENDFNKTLLDNENLKDDNIEYRMTQLLKSSQYRNEVSHLFQNLEHSICQLGPNQDPFQQSIVNQMMENTNWPDDSFMTEAFLNGLTQNTESGSIGDQLKKALKENAVKAVEPQNLVNRTVLNSDVTFQELGPFYGLPSKVKELIKIYKGIDNLYDWQDECLNLPAVKHRKNLIYSLPTSGGKTLVAEILILRELICRKRNVIFVLPYVAIVQEKVWALSPFAVALDFLIEEYAAGKGGYPPRKRRHKNSVYIATTEKALGIVNSLVEQGRLEELGLVVVDELHLIGDEQRGPTLEALLSKLMFINDDVQIVGMSATIGNLPDMQQFLNAEVYTRNFRPVELTEYVKCEHHIAKVNWNADEDRFLEVVRTVDFQYSEDLIKIDPDRLGGLVMETVPQGSCLIFCPSKKSCENVTKLLCRVVFRTLKDYKTQEKLQLLCALKNEAGTLCPILQESVPYGIVYHHSGLTAEERRLIEESYRSGILCVICCTSTLAAGVNLPAKRVIIRKPYIAQTFINLSRYKQMIGRAGRAGLGEIGESILICTREELQKVKQLLMSPMDQILSKMCNSERLRLLLLSCISLGTANTIVQLQQVTKMSLLAVQQEKLNVDLKKLIKQVIADLFNFNVIEIFDGSNKSTKSNSNKSIKNNSSCMSDISVCFSFSELSSPSSSGLQKSCEKKPKRQFQITNTTKLVITKSGTAAIKGGLELHQAMLLYDDLQKAQDSLVLVDCLHLLYLVTPYNLVEQIKPDRNHYYNIMMNLGKQEKKTADILGIKDAYIMRMFSNQRIKAIPERVLNKFYASLMLYDLWNEASVFDVSEKYQVNRGIVQGLMTQSATFAANVVNFCEQFEEFWAFTHLLRGMSQRLAHCCCRDLLPLMELPAVKQSRARQLFNAGFKNLQSIAKADPNELVQAIDFMSNKVANQLIAAAKMLLLEKVETLREEAEDILDGVENPKLIFNQTFHVK